jgi:gamma-glutamylcysteine synthetase
VTIEYTFGFTPGIKMFRVTPGAFLAKRGVCTGPWCYSRLTALVFWLATTLDDRDHARKFPQGFPKL